jgi:hypothetical protein
VVLAAPRQRLRLHSAKRKNAVIQACSGGSDDSGARVFDGPKKRLPCAHRHSLTPITYSGKDWAALWLASVQWELHGKGPYYAALVFEVVEKNRNRPVLFLRSQSQTRQYLRHVPVDFLLVNCCDFLKNSYLKGCKRSTCLAVAFSIASAARMRRSGSAWSNTSKTCEISVGFLEISCATWLELPIERRSPPRNLFTMSLIRLRS